VGVRPLKKHPAPEVYPTGRCRRSSISSSSSSFKPESLLLDPASLRSAAREVILSPVPLPKGVVCIDPTDDHTMSYFQDFVRYNMSKSSLAQMLEDYIFRAFIDYCTQVNFMRTSI
jgi:hypothetical protein